MKKRLTERKRKERKTQINSELRAFYKPQTQIHQTKKINKKKK